MHDTSLPPGFFQAGLRAPQMPPGLERKAESAGITNIQPQDARSFSSQLIVEQYSLSITARIQTAAPSETEQGSPPDSSAEATAQRILDFSTSLFGVYQAQNPDESAESALADFEQLVRDAIDEGFSQARGILEDLDKLDEQTAEFVDETYSILQLMLDKFFADAPEGGEAAEAVPGEGALDSSWQTFELEYQYLSYESFSASQSAGGEGNDGSFVSTEYMRLQYESLSISMNYGNAAPESTLQYVV